MMSEKTRGLVMLTIRNETEKDYRTVEILARRAFWNLYTPGCFEHYLMHVMRRHEDFVPELDLVLELDGQIIGSIMYTKAKLVDETGEEKEILTFGPLCIAPEHQRKGYGKMLMAHSFEKATEMGYDVVVIFGSPANYVSSGFQSCKKYNICFDGGKFPSAMMVNELVAGTLDGKRRFYRGSSVMTVSEEEAAAYDETFERMEKSFSPSQEAFYIMKNSFVD